MLTTTLRLGTAAALLLSLAAAAAGEPAAPERGPRMTDPEFFAALDLKLPGMEPVARAAGAKDWPAARAALLAYFAERIPKAQVKPDPRYNLERADRVCRHLFSMQNREAQLPPVIDWRFNPTQDREWTWIFNRHGDWGTLVRAYLATRDEKYVREFDAQASGWVAQCPVPPKVDNRGPSWRTIEVGCRAGSWINAFRTLYHAPGFRGETKIDLLKSTIEQCRYLEKYPTGSNWVMIETNGLLHWATTFPELAESARWIDLGYRRFHAELEEQIYPDGTQQELSTLYYMVCVGRAAGALDLSKGREHLVPESFRRILERMYAGAMLLARPTGDLPMVNDADVLNIRAILGAGTRHFGRADFRHFATAGKEGVVTRHDSVYLPYAGFVVMRSGWDPADRFLLLDAGPFGGHCHEDALNFDCSAFGQPMILDPGRWSYAGDAMSRFMRGSFSHNVMLVDGQEQARHKLPSPARANPAPPSRLWVSTPDFDFAEGLYDDGYGPLPDRSIGHHRRILFVKPDYWVVSDLLEGTGRHRFDALFHFAPGKAAVDPATGGVSVAFEKAGVRLLPVLPEDTRVEVVEGREDPVQGWVSWEYGKREPAPAAIYTWDAEAPTRAAFAVVPGEGPPPGASCRALPAEPEGAVALEVATATGKDLVLIAPGIAGAKRFAGFKTDAQIALVRLAADGSVKKVAACLGRKLSREGRMLWQADSSFPGMPPANAEGPEKTRVSVHSDTYHSELTTRRGLEVRLPASAVRGRDFRVECTYHNSAGAPGEPVVLRLSVPRIALMGLKPSAWEAAAEERFPAPAAGQSVRKAFLLKVPASLPVGRHPLLVTAGPVEAPNQEKLLVLHAGVEVRDAVTLELDPSGLSRFVGAPDAREFAFTLRARNNRSIPTLGQCRLEVPKGWRVTPAPAEVDLEPRAVARREFRVTPPAGVAPGRYVVRPRITGDPGDLRGPEAAVLLKREPILGDFEAGADGWEGVVPDGARAQRGRQSGRWDDHIKTKAITLKEMPHDWSLNDALEFRLYSAKANGAGIQLVLYSHPADAKEWGNYYQKEIRVDWEGWRHFRIPWDQFIATRKPAGWHQIDSITFTASGWYHEPQPDTALWIDDVALR